MDRGSINLLIYLVIYAFRFYGLTLKRFNVLPSNVFIRYTVLPVKVNALIFSAGTRAPKPP